VHCQNSSIQGQQLQGSNEFIVWLPQYMYSTLELAPRMVGSMSENPPNSYVVSHIFNHVTYERNLKNKYVSIV
jgi:hypothetical protein